MRGATGNNSSWRLSKIRSIIVSCAVLATIALPARASAQAVHAGHGAKGEIHLSQPLVVGTHTLKSGDYTIQCKTVNGQEYLVVTSVEDRAEVARVPCTPQTLQKKVAISEFRSVGRPDGSNVLTAVRIQGESIEHRIKASETPVWSRGAALSRAA